MIKQSRHGLVNGRWNLNFKLSFNYNLNPDVTQKDGGLEYEFWESQTNNESTVYSSSMKNLLSEREMNLLAWLSIIAVFTYLQFYSTTILDITFW